MTLIRDPLLMVVRRLTVLFGTVLLDLDVIWGQGSSLAAWLVRVAFNGLFLCEIIIDRGEIERIRLDDAVIGRAGRAREHFWQGVAGLVHCHPCRCLPPQLLRCDCPDGTVMHLRVHPRDTRRLAEFIKPTTRLRSGPLTRTVDRVRAGTTYEE